MALINKPERSHIGASLWLFCSLSLDQNGGQTAHQAVTNIYDIFVWLIKIYETIDTITVYRLYRKRSMCLVACQKYAHGSLKCLHKESSCTMD